MRGYETIKRLAKEAGCTIPDLLVLARQNDPFFVGSKTDRAKAEWFVKLWHEFGYTTGVHLRRVHYRLISQESPVKHDGTPYENTEGCWDYLCAAGKYARHLGLVNPAAFVDRRNPEPYIYMTPGPSPSPDWVYEFPAWELPKIETDLRYGVALRMPYAWTVGYDYEDCLQPYHVEVWCEKSTMNGELLPLCRRHAVNLVTGVGYMSITSVIDLIRRVSELEKPCRILYVSDFDPAGSSMPISVARQIEYGLATYAPGKDIKLNPVILTATQVEEYGLPRTPIKETDRRRRKFEAVHGAGAVELDALEALHPGEFARTVERGIRAFRDEGLSRKVEAIRDLAEERLSSALAERLSTHEAELEEIREGVAAVLERYQDRLEELDNALQAELEPYRSRHESLRQAVQNEFEDIEPDLPDLPEPETSPERDGWLFDSGRNYFEQLIAYKEHQNGGGTA